MSLHRNHSLRFALLTVFILSLTVSGYARISRVLQDQYRRDYEHKAMVLKIPVYGDRQNIAISGNRHQIEPGAGTPRFRIGDQLRVLQLDFGRDEIRFRMGAVSGADTIELIFKFAENLLEEFPNRAVFDRALQSVLMERLTYSEIEDARTIFIKDQFEQSLHNLAGSAAISRDAVLTQITTQIPAYQEARKEITTLKENLQSITRQLAAMQSQNQRLESEMKSQQTEAARLRSSHAAMQEKIDASAAQITKLGSDLREARGAAQEYQREFSAIQRSLNLELDSNKDLTKQIAEFGRFLKKLQADNDSLEKRLQEAQTGLEAQKTANTRLSGDNEELKSANSKLQQTIKTLSSKEDSLAKQYITLREEKDKLHDFSRSVELLHSRLVEEKSEYGIHRGKSDVYMNEILLGSISWSIPTSISRGQSNNARAEFTAAPIDPVQASPEERDLLRTFGGRLRVRFELASGAGSLAITPEQNDGPMEIAERETAAWQWKIDNGGTRDSRLLLTAHLINRNADEIPLLRREQDVIASTIVRRIRNYLQPVPLAAGALLGFLLFGIVGIFRRPGKQRPSAGKPPVSRPTPPSAHPHSGTKQL
ncbi:MAG TPA: hypothetical protein VLL97_08970 [Acidobacteriota bacterium]|nr:hypothetical protein [Acidobacteriota bacterium]